MTISTLKTTVLQFTAPVRRAAANHPYRALAVIVLVLGAGWFSFGRAGAEPPQTAIAEAKAFVQQVSVSGRVTAADDVGLAFDQNGRVVSLAVAVGDQVPAGQTLAALEAGTVAAQLAAAQADVSRARVARANQQVNLDQVEREEDTKVDNARRTLFSEGLVAEPASTGYGVLAPTLSGAYRGTSEAAYRFRIDLVQGGIYDLQVFDAERTTIRISKTGPTPLGQSGLFVTFPADLARYANTTWVVSIPNRESSEYLANLNAYQEAQRARARAIEDARAQVTRSAQGLTIADAELASAQAQVARLQAELAGYRIRAPFAGTITAIDVELGETVSPGESAITMISADRLEIESFVPEVNIAFIEVGDAAVVTLDAFGESVPFTARVIAIDPAETIRDGVSTYRVRLTVDDPEGKVKSGMTANIVITTDQRESVLQVPQGAIIRRDGSSFVRIRVGETATEDRRVVVGPVSTLGEVEILSGLTAGEVIEIPRR